MTPIQVLITLLAKSHDPPSRRTETQTPKTLSLQQVADVRFMGAPSYRPEPYGALFYGLGFRVSMAALFSQIRLVFVGFP